MIETRTLIKHQIDKRMYTLSVSPDSPLVEIQQALIFFKGVIFERQQEAAIQQEKAENEKITEIEEAKSCDEAS